MSAVPVMISGVLWDHASKSGRAVTLMGEATIPGLGVGGGPIIPGQPPGIWGPTDPFPGYGLPGQPPGIWGGGNVPMPTPPIHLGPGGDIGGPPGIGGGPIIPVPPDSPNVPPPGSPPVIVGGTHPTHPITPPNAVLIEYPGIGKVVVPKPTETAHPPAQPKK